MPFFHWNIQALSRWLDVVAAWIVATYAKIVAAPAVRLVEERDGAFTVQATGKAASAPERIRIVNGEVVAAGAGNAAAMLKASRAELGNSCCSPRASCSGRSSFRAARPSSSTASWRANRPAHPVERGKRRLRLERSG
jgi:hypothetical protein